MREQVEAEPEPEVATPDRVAPAPLLPRLQRTAGNRAVGRIVARQAATWTAEEVEAVHAYSQAWMDKTEASKRAAIVKLAASQEGKVKDAAGPDGKRAKR
jgi:hypothetical protein